VEKKKKKVRKIIEREKKKKNLSGVGLEPTPTSVD